MYLLDCLNLLLFVLRKMKKHDSFIQKKHVDYLIQRLQYNGFNINNIELEDLNAV